MDETFPEVPLVDEPRPEVPLLDESFFGAEGLVLATVIGREP